MIFVKGYGQMCNNILQYSHIYAWGKENGIKVISMRFSYKYQYFALCKQRYHNWLMYIFAKFLIKTHLIKHLWLECPEEVTPESEEELKKARIIALSGWSFRHPELFLKYKDDIKKQFAFNEQTRRHPDAFFASCAPSDIRLAVHIRRGDYARFMGGIYFYDDNTYIRNIREFMALFPGKKVSVFICTNDKHLDINVYRKQTGCEQIHLFRGNEGEDLYLLSQCDYIIGAKSTFSLVASFYRDVPIYHIMDKETSLTLDKFKHFDEIFMLA